MVMASPPQTYLGLMSVMAMFLTSQHNSSQIVCRPLPLMTPEVPSPMRDLLELTVIPSEPALSLLVSEPWQKSIWSSVLGHRDRGSTRLVVGAPVILVDGYLAARGSTPRRAASRGGGTLGSSKVKGLGKHNHTGLAITKVRDQLVGGGRIDGGSAATASHGRGKTLGGALDANRNGLGDQRTDGGKKSSVLHPGSRHRTNDRVK